MIIDEIARGPNEWAAHTCPIWHVGQPGGAAQPEHYGVMALTCDSTSP